MRSPVIAPGSVHAPEMVGDAVSFMESIRTVRHDRLSVNQVERLRKRVDANAMKREGVTATAKEGWREEAECLLMLIEMDNATITAQLHRRVFIRAWCVFGLSYG
jgi:hypothetical protein